MSFLTTDFVTAAERYETCVMDLLSATERPSQAALRLGAVKAYGEEHGAEVARTFADKIYDCIQKCRLKLGSLASGVKLDPPVQKIALLMKRLRKQRLSNSNSAGSQSPPSSSKKKSSCSGSQASSQSPDEIKSQVLALYGFSTFPTTSSSSSSSAVPHVVATAANDEVAFIMSSQEASPVQRKIRPSSQPEQKTANNYVETLDTGARRLVRIYASGEKVYADMQPGPNMFAIAIFPDDPSNAVVTELPNAVLGAVAKPVLKRPAAPVSSKQVKKMEDSTSS